MAVVNGTVHTVNGIDGYGGQISALQVVQILFTVSGTYAQADNGILAGIPTLIANSRRNGKTATLVDAMCGHPATKESNAAQTMALKTVAVSGSDITFEITDGDFSTEFADATAVPAQARPFALLVSFTES